jgi:hypothetical protein
VGVKLSGTIWSEGDRRPRDGRHARLRRYSRPPLAVAHPRMRCR